MFIYFPSRPSDTQSLASSTRESRASSNPPPSMRMSVADGSNSGGSFMSRFNIKKHKRIDLHQYEQDEGDGGQRPPFERRRSSGDPDVGPTTPTNPAAASVGASASVSAAYSCDQISLASGGTPSPGHGGVGGGAPPSSSRSSQSPHMAAGNVLKKAASISLEERSPGKDQHQQGGSGGKPRFTLEERSDFREMEKFEGRLFISWIAANLSQDNYLKIMMTEQDLKFVGGFFGTLLLRAGVMKAMEPEQVQQQGSSPDGSSAKVTILHPLLYSHT